MAVVDPKQKPVVDDFQKKYQQGGKFKEQLEAIAGTFNTGGLESREVSGKKETAVDKMAEVPVSVEVEKKPELSGYMEEVEQQAELAQTSLDDYTNQVLLGQNSQGQKKVTLPLTDDQIQEGLHHKIWESIRWLAEWCVRQIKMIKP